MNIVISLHPNLLKEILKEYFLSTDGDDDPISLEDFIVDILEIEVKEL